MPTPAFRLLCNSSFSASRAIFTICLTQQRLKTEKVLNHPPSSGSAVQHSGDANANSRTPAPSLLLLLLCSPILLLGTASNTQHLFDRSPPRKNGCQCGQPKKAKVKAFDQPPASGPTIRPLTDTSQRQLPATICSTPSAPHQV